jgi:alpha-mannosidase
MQVSLEHQNPLVAGMVSGTETIFPDKDYSFLEVSDPNVLLWSLKPAEDGPAKGIIARMWNVGNTNSMIKLSFEPQISSAFQTTHLETDTDNASVVNGVLQESINHHQMKTFRIVLKEYSVNNK